MNDLAENLERLVLENKLSKAHQEIRKFLKQEHEISQRLFELFQKVFGILKEDDDSLIISFLKISLDSKINISKFLLKTLVTINEESFFYLYPIAKKYFIENGMLSDFEKVFVRYKKNLLKSKSYTRLIEELEDIEEYGIDVVVSREEEALCHYGLVDIDYFEKKYEGVLLRKEKTILNNVQIDLNNSIWRKQTFIMKERVIRSYGNRSLESRKEFLKSIYELILGESEVESCFVLLFEYSIEMGHKDFADELKKILVSNYEHSPDRLEKAVKELRPISRDSFEEIDLADDLFDGGVDAKDLTIRRLVNQINILKDERDLEGATKLLEKLKTLDKDHTLIKELEEKEHKIKGSKSAKVLRTISEVEQDLLNELSVYSEIGKKDILEEESYLKMYTKKVIDMMPMNHLREQYRELVYSYNTLGFYDNSLLIIERLVFESALDVKEEIEIEFLRAEVMRMSQNYYGALNNVEKCIEEKAMTDSEKISFYYLKGEILRELGRKKDALKAYAVVYGFNKKYRMVSYRLKEIE
ncbi:hypothetical protein [Halobacteriovorax sp. JY17]|uniref:hypothetical protein n=1 Tax=Halobacteriovorax sp. JY17 TaxID=2014617 RepID=UPI000C54E2EE|nr:hypothetical protein [Halobacteriovorax sp. JY17]PIK14487.1 MAG: hypothetical protein CES88_09080 [Halobacteriovorax sp. JY17]